jgi:hypothetical protein
VTTQDFARYASFESSEDNQAYVINEDLCPKGKFGYDARCRSWYSDAKHKALHNGIGIHITPPYEFATVTDVGTTAVSPLIDPRTGEFVGVTSSDFETTEIQKIFDDSTIHSIHCTYAVTMPNVPANSNTVASSNMPSGSTPLALSKVLLPYDSPQDTNQKNLVSILEKMDEGKTGIATVKRTDEDGLEETFSVVYSPIYIRELKPIQADDYTRGTMASDVHLYSVIMIIKEDDLHNHFNAIADDIEQNLERASLFFLVMTGVLTAAFIVVTARVSEFIY